MSISVSCSSCGKTFKTKEELAGKRVKCPSCGQVITVSASRPPSHAKEISVLPVQAPDNSPPKTEAASPAVQERRRVRWPLYAGLGAVALCLVSGVVFVFSMLGTKSAEDEVVDFLAAREVLQHSISGSRLSPDLIDWIALGVSEPLDQGLALAQVLNFGGDFLQDKTRFDGVYKDSVESGIRVGLIDCKAATKLLRENKDFAKNTLTAADQVLASDVVRKQIASTGVTMNRSFTAESASYTAKTVAIIKKGAPPEMAEVHVEFRQAIREALRQHPELAESLKRNIKLAAEVRASHNHVGRMIRAASSG